MAQAEQNALRGLKRQICDTIDAVQMVAECTDPTSAQLRSAKRQCVECASQLERQATLMELQSEIDVARCADEGLAEDIELAEQAHAQHQLGGALSSWQDPGSMHYGAQHGAQQAPPWQQSRSAQPPLPPPQHQPAAAPDLAMPAMVCTLPAPKQQAQPVLPASTAAQLPVPPAGGPTLEERLSSGPPWEAQAQLHELQTQAQQRKLEQLRVAEDQKLQQRRLEQLRAAEESAAGIDAALKAQELAAAQQAVARVIYAM